MADTSGFGDSTPLGAVAVGASLASGRIYVAAPDRHLLVRDTAPDAGERGVGLVEQWLTAWAKPDLVAVSKIIVTTLVENVLQHTDSAPSVRLETDGDTVAVAVGDYSRTPPTCRRDSRSSTPWRASGAMCPPLRARRSGLS